MFWVNLIKSVFLTVCHKGWHGGCLKEQALSYKHQTNKLTQILVINIISKQT